MVQKLRIDGLELCPVHLQVLIDAIEAQGLGEGTKWEGNRWNGLELHPAAAFEDSAVSYHPQRSVLGGQAAPSLEERISRHQYYESVVGKEPSVCLLTVMEEVSLEARQLLF